MGSKTADITTGLRLATQCPLDEKTFFKTLEDLADLGNDNNKAFTYYEGMGVYCLEDKKHYIWEEVGFGQEGIIPGSFVYPPNTIVDEIDYSGRVFNFVISAGQSGSLDLFFIEPSVNIRIDDNINTLGEAMHFGNFDIGNGVMDYALVKNTFASQSGYNILSTANIGDEIKLYNATNQKYLRHFKLTATVYGDYLLMDIIEKGNWTPEGILFPIQKLVINLLRETNYSIQLNGSVITLYRGAAAVGTADLSALLGPVGSSITSGVLNPITGIVTFTLADTSTFDVDFSGLINADDFIKRTGNIAAKGKDIYENLFVSKAVNGFYGKGYYAVDLSTNYNNTTFPGFPYPANRDYVLALVNGARYVMIKKNNFAFRRLFLNPNTVIGLSFFKYRDNAEKSMQFIAYTKILTRATTLVGLNSDYYAFPIYGTLDTVIPLPSTGAPFNETGVRAGINEADAYCIFTQVATEGLSLKKSIQLPYTLRNEDHGRILHLGGSTGAVTIPKLNYGFECGFLQSANDAQQVSFVAGTGVQIFKPATKEAIIEGQYHTAYIYSNDEFTAGGTLELESDSFVLCGDLKNS